jgi:hypothetical protein
MPWEVGGFVKRVLIASICFLGAATAGAQQIVLNPGVSLQHFTSNVNDIYDGGRGMAFTMNSTIQVNSFGFFTAGLTGPATWTLRQITNLSGDLNTGSTLIKTQIHDFIGGGPAYSDSVLFAPVTLTAGNSYHLEITYSQAAGQNHFYDWNGPSVNIGVLTLLDGTQGGNTSNTVAPGFRINAVPEPASMAALALGAGLLARRRNRRK